MPMLDLTFKHSKQYIVLLVAVTLLCSIVVLTLPWGHGLKFAAFSVVLVYCLNLIYQFGLLMSPRSIIGMRHLSGGQWRLYTRKGSDMAILLGDSTVTPWLSVLRFKPQTKNFPSAYIVFCDSLSAEDYRKLVVQLRHARVET